MRLEVSGRGLSEVHQALASTPPCECVLIFFCHSLSMRSALAVEAIDVTSRESVLVFTAWMLSMNCSTADTASRLVARSSVLK